MTTNDVFNATIPYWPVALMFALFFTFLAPDGLRKYAPEVGEEDEIRGGFSILLLIVWVAVILWPSPAYMSTPGAKTLDGQGAFWRQVWVTLGNDVSWVHAVAFGYASLLYIFAGVVWAIVYFWLYARRLGHIYVIERDAWMARQGVERLENLTEVQRGEFSSVIVAVQRSMVYYVDFPLRAFQQKRFFVSNCLLWPLTLAWYLLSDWVVDIARGIWFALRHWIHRKYQEGMVEFIGDDTLCREKAKEFGVDKEPELSASLEA